MSADRVCELCCGAGGMGLGCEMHPGYFERAQKRIEGASAQASLERFIEVRA